MVGPLLHRADRPACGDASKANAARGRHLERQFERDSYLGLPCLDSEGRVIGHVACADPGPMPAELPHQAILTLFAVRASMELERRRLERERGALGMRNFGPSLRLH
jgi:GAF domain-containing protein